MISGRVVFPKIPVDGKRQHGHGPEEGLPGMRRARRRIEAGHQAGGCQLGQMNGGIVDDSNQVVKIPGGIQGVRIARENQTKEQDCRQGASNQMFVLCLHFNIHHLAATGPLSRP